MIAKEAIARTMVHRYLSHWLRHFSERRLVDLFISTENAFPHLSMWEVSDTLDMTLETLVKRAAREQSATILEIGAKTP